MSLIKILDEGYRQAIVQTIYSFLNVILLYILKVNSGTQNTNVLSLSNPM